MADDDDLIGGILHEFLDGAMAAAKAAQEHRMRAQFQMLKERMVDWEKCLETGAYDKFPALFLILESEFEAKCVDCGLVHDGGVVPSAVGMGGCIDPDTIPDVLEQIAGYLRMANSARAGLN